MNQLLGLTVRDRISGFQGVVTGFVEYLSGCNQALVLPPIAPDGAYRDALWFDAQRLEEVPGTLRVTLDNGATPGFDRPAPRR